MEFSNSPNSGVCTPGVDARAGGSVQGGFPLSVVINTLNEEANIAACVASVRWAQQIIVVDMMSEDQTASIAEGLGCEVFTHPRSGYVEPAREFAVSKARNNWVLILDADERCSEGLAAWIQANLASARFCGVSIPRRNHIRNQWVKCCGWYPDSQLRLLNRKSAVFSREIHKAPVVGGAVLKLESGGPAYLLHFAVASMGDRLHKLVRYSEISARFLSEKGKKGSAPMILVRVLWSFVSSYFLRGGIFNGGLGLVLSMERANATFMKYAIFWDAESAKPKSDVQ